MSDLYRSSPPHDRFLPTAWTVISQARSNSEDPARAWDHIYRWYWQPVCTFLYRQGQTRDRAEEIAQQFFSWLWEQDVIARAEQSRGKFRNFLLASLKQFVLRDLRYQHAAKRNPASSNGALVEPRSDQRFDTIDRRAHSADRQFDRSCALELLQHAIDRLRGEYQRAGQEHRFESLCGFLTGDDAASFEKAASALGMTESAVRVTLHRMRKRYGQILREEIAATVVTEDDVDDEIHSLFRAIRTGG